MSPLWWLPIAIGGLLIFVGIVNYNFLIGKRNQIKKVQGGLNALLKKRWDLVPNLVAAVSRYMKHEAEVLENLTKLRTRQSGTDQISSADSDLSAALGRLRLAVENYPELKASQNFLQLQAALNETEEQISAGRRAYNAAVEEYNNALEMFPSNIIAQMIGFKRESFFEIPASEQENINVRHLFQNEQ